MEYGEEAAKNLYAAMKGLGTDEDAITKELVSYTNEGRQYIRTQFLSMYGKTLEECLEKEIGGKFLKACLALLTPSDEYEAICLREAIAGCGTDEDTCIQILCTKEAYEIQSLQDAYNRIFKRNLSEDMAHEEGGYLGRIFRSLCEGGRADFETNRATAAKEAKELYEAGQGKIGTDEVTFLRILCSRSYDQLRLTFSEYLSLTKNDIEAAIQSEMSGDLKKALLTIVKSVKNKSKYFAEKLHEAIQGAGTNDELLIRILVSRSDVDLGQVKTEYQKLYGKSLYDAVKDDTSGDYRKLLLGLIKSK